MTENFNINRLGQLIRKQWIENSKWYLYSALAITGLLGIIFTFWLFANNGQYQEDIIYIFFLGGLFISGVIFASVSFSSLGDKAKATYWLSFPASHLEKLICHIFYCVIVFTLLYLICFFVVYSLVVLYINDMVARYPDEYRYIPIKDAAGFWQPYYAFIYAYFGVQAFYLMGSVFFPRLSIIITSAIAAAIIILFNTFIAILNKSMFPDQAGWSWNIFYVDHYQGLAEIYRYQLSPFWQNTLSLLMKFIWAPVFWLIAWFRLKEKQV